ncbi:hypothetical protein [Variovorax sp. GrIS 2.14]
MTVDRVRRVSFLIVGIGGVAGTGRRAVAIPARTLWLPGIGNWPRMSSRP